MAVMQNHKIAFSSKVENLSLVEKLVEEVCDEYKVNTDHYGNILVGLTEAVNNAILHGNKNDLSKKVSIEFVPKGDILSFFVKDEGAGFDPSSIPDPTNPENIEKPNGRGVFLMRNLADKVIFHDNGSRVELHFKAIA
jgi:serine/threonine-protein kinase RsbW